MLSWIRHMGGLVSRTMTHVVGGALLAEAASVTIQLCTVTNVHHPDLAVTYANWLSISSSSNMLAVV
jgi:hypothetical protein